jgi:ribosomal protein L11 methyltransferase
LAVVVCNFSILFASNSKYMENYIQVSIAVQPGERAEIVLAILAANGFEGFEETAEGLKAFIVQTDFDEAILRELLAAHHLEYSLQTIEQQNWNAQWESGFEPVRVNDFAAIRASFHAPCAGVEHEVIITPKMSFGTGHHATTYMMVEQMEQINFAEKSVLDFGTGTGVLAILAEKMGASSILGIDNDDWSITNTIENLEANGCHHTRAEKAEAVPIEQQFDIILANINLNVITASLLAIVKACKPGAKVLLSGFLAADVAVLVPLLEAHLFQKVEIFERNNWRCIAAVLN